MSAIVSGTILHVSRLNPILGWASRCHCEDDEPDDEYNCWDYHELKTQESVRPVTYWLKSKR